MTEKKLLKIVETLKYFRNILLGHGIEVFTEHNNIVLLNDRELLSVRIVLEEINAGVWDEYPLY